MFFNLCHYKLAFCFPGIVLASELNIGRALPDKVKREYGQEDFWAPPVEFMTSRDGDCADFSTAKYFTLREPGADDIKMRITYARALELNQAHTVLNFFSNSDKEPLIPDNLINEIKPTSQRTNLKPVYNFKVMSCGAHVSRGKIQGLVIPVVSNSGPI